MKSDKLRSVRTISLSCWPRSCGGNDKALSNGPVSTPVGLSVCPCVCPFICLSLHLFVLSSLPSAVMLQLTRQGQQQRRTRPTYVSALLSSGRCVCFSEKKVSSHTQFNRKGKLACRSCIDCTAMTDSDCMLRDALYNRGAVACTL